MTQKDGLIAGKTGPLEVSSLAAVKATREQRAVLRERFERNVAAAREGKGLPNSDYFLEKCGSESKPR